MSDELRDDVRATSEHLLADSEKLAQIERRKLDRAMSPDEVAQLSTEAAELTREMAHTAGIQEQLAAESDQPE